MSAGFEFTPQAAEDLDAIWWFIAEDNREAADRVEAEIGSPSWGPSINSAGFRPPPLRDRRKA
jgi:plasmid stabilization system protein ParE